MASLNLRLFDRAKFANAFDKIGKKFNSLQDSDRRDSKNRWRYQNAVLRAGAGGWTAAKVASETFSIVDVASPAVAVANTETERLSEQFSKAFALGRDFTITPGTIHLGDFTGKFALHGESRGEFHLSDRAGAFENEHIAADLADLIAHGNRVYSKRNSNELMFPEPRLQNQVSIGGPISHECARLHLEYGEIQLETTIGLKRTENPLFELPFEYVLDHDGMSIKNTRRRGVAHETNWWIRNVANSEKFIPAYSTTDLREDYLLITSIPILNNIFAYERQQRNVLIGGCHNLSTEAFLSLIQIPGFLSRIENETSGLSVWQCLIKIKQVFHQNTQSHSLICDVDGMQIRPGEINASLKKDFLDFARSERNESTSRILDTSGNLMGTNLESLSDRFPDLILVEEVHYDGLKFSIELKPSSKVLPLEPGEKEPSLSGLGSGGETPRNMRNEEMSPPQNWRDSLDLYREEELAGIGFASEIECLRAIRDVKLKSKHLRRMPFMCASDEIIIVPKTGLNWFLKEMKLSSIEARQVPLVLDHRT